MLTAAIFAALLLPVLVQQGMFLDGVTHACIARNMANGLGSFSRPYYTPALDPVFFGQPPLALWMQSQFFKIFGDHFWVERLFSFCIAILSVLGILMNWQMLHKERLKQEVSLFSTAAWLSVLLWIASPIVFWSYQNNMLECTMVFFVLLATYFGIKSVFEGKNGLLLIAALFTTAAVLCKGPVGFFPVAVPLVVGFVFRPIGLASAISRSAILFSITLAILAAIISFVPGMQQYWDLYLHKQLLPTLAGTQEKPVENRTKILLDLLSQLILPAILVGLVWAKGGFRSLKIPKPALLFITLGLVGSLPLMALPKQSTHYLVPAMPFFALGFAAIFLENFSWSKSKSARNNRWKEYLAWLILLASIAFSLSFWGKYNRDEQKIREVQAICSQVGGGEILGVPPHLSTDWLLIAYFGRLGNVGLDQNAGHNYWLTEKDGQFPPGYEKHKLLLDKYELWQKNSPKQ